MSVSSAKNYCKQERGGVELGGVRDILLHNCYIPPKETHAPYASYIYSSHPYSLSTSAEVMYCKPPVPSYIKGLERLELKFRLQSKPVVALILLFLLNSVLYIVLLPVIVSAHIWGETESDQVN